MKAGLIAAGEGARLRPAHPDTPKPLVPVAGVPLVHWVVKSLSRAGISDFTMLHNSRSRAVRPSLQAAFPKMTWRFLEENTASSWESFRLVSRELMHETDFIISTIDALISPRDLTLFIESVKKTACDAALGLTSFIDDEKPLFADLGEDGRISRLGPSAVQKRYVTSGLYYLRGLQARRLPPVSGFTRLREYWTSEVDRGARISGIVLSKTLDVDRPEDIKTAERFVREISAEESLA